MMPFDEAPVRNAQIVLNNVKPINGDGIPMMMIGGFFFLFQVVCKRSGISDSEWHVRRDLGVSVSFRGLQMTTVARAGQPSFKCFGRVFKCKYNLH